MGEPNSTAFILAALGTLMALSVLFSRLAGKANVPVLLLFIVVGMVAGSEGVGGLEFSDYGLAFRIGSAALVLILFDGGLNTPMSAVREVVRPAAVLATLGVLFTAGALAALLWLLGAPWQVALLVGAIVSSTDAAAVFSVLRGSGLHVKKRVGLTLELESGINDPMAVILTMAVTNALVSGEFVWWRMLGETVLQLVVGTALGIGIGFGGRELLRRSRLAAAGLYPVLSLAIAFFAFGLPTLVHGSGIIGVYVAGLVIGNSPGIRYRSGVVRVHDALAWFGQVTMFMVLGLLVFPSQLVPVAPMGLAAGIVLAVVARPLAVLLCIIPFKFTLKERMYLSWVGLRGAVPIILSTFPVLAGAAGGAEVFNIVFFVVVVSALVPGATVPWITRKLGLESRAPPPPAAALEITSTQVLSAEMVGFHIDRASAACGASIADLPFPESATAAMIVRGKELIAPKGNTTLQPEDHVYVFCKQEDLPLVKLIFGEQETE